MAIRFSPVSFSHGTLFLLWFARFPVSRSSVPCPIAVAMMFHVVSWCTTCVSMSLMSFVPVAETVTTNRCVLLEETPSASPPALARDEPAENPRSTPRRSPDGPQQVTEDLRALRESPSVHVRACVRVGSWLRVVFSRLLKTMV